ncbi:hypothetical protein SHKM778_71730 [Streptomyces sp. KM77-8]|uniref:Uncharacterized protein n=1 Tax=Streptomyces haneummycinicus TaxID=3074435 RepID=A0AAT9HTH0_9ACTN
MDLAQLPHDDRPFALLRRRTPGHDHDVVELLIGPVGTRDLLAELPDECLAVVPFRQIRERGFDVRDDGTPLLVLTPEERYEIPLAEALDRLPPMTWGCRAAASTSATRSTRGSSGGSWTRRSAGARAPTS